MWKFHRNAIASKILPSPRQLWVPIVFKVWPCFWWMFKWLILFSTPPLTFYHSTNNNYTNCTVNPFNKFTSTEGDKFNYYKRRHQVNSERELQDCFQKFNWNIMHFWVVWHVVYVYVLLYLYCIIIYYLFYFCIVADSHWTRSLIQ